MAMRAREDVDRERALHEPGPGSIAGHRLPGGIVPVRTTRQYDVGEQGTISHHTGVPARIGASTPWKSTRLIRGRGVKAASFSSSSSGSNRRCRVPSRPGRPERKQNTAENGERVVAMINDEVTLKRYYRDKSHIRLEPANGSMQPIVVDPNDQTSVLGVLVGVLRKC